MSYLTYNGKMVQSNGQYAIGVGQVTRNVLNFNNASYVTFSGQPTFYPNSPVNFYMYLDNDSAYSYDFLFSTCNTTSTNTGHFLMAYLNGDLLRIHTGVLIDLQRLVYQVEMARLF